MGAITKYFFEEAATAIWVGAGTYIVTIAYSISCNGSGAAGLYNFTNHGYYEYADTFSNVTDLRRTITRIITVDGPVQIGMEVSGDIIEAAYKITALKIKNTI